MPINAAVFAKETAITVVFAFACVGVAKGAYHLGRELISNKSDS